MLTNPLSPTKYSPIYIYIYIYSLLNSMHASDSLLLRFQSVFTFQSRYKPEGFDKRLRGVCRRLVSYSWRTTSRSGVSFETIHAESDRDYVPRAPSESLSRLEASTLDDDDPVSRAFGRKRCLVNKRKEKKKKARSCTRERETSFR